MSDTLSEILSTYTPSGREKENSKPITDNLLKYTNDIKIDSLGNIIGNYFTSTSGCKTIMLDAHYDEVSLVVTEILSDGFLRFSSSTGMDIRCIIANDVVVHGQVDINAVVTSTPPHLVLENNIYPKESELFIDTGLDNNKLREIVSVGDAVTFKENYNHLCGTNIYSKGLDNKISVYIILEVLKKLKQNDVKCNVVTLFSTGEEANGIGAGAGTYNVNPDIAIVLDVSFAKTPNTNADKCGQATKGVMIGVSPSLDINVSNKLREIAGTKNIPYQIEVMSGGTGTNASFIAKSRMGVSTSLLSIPIKYMHTGIETVDTIDVLAVIDLVYEYILFVSKEIRLW
ncbi:MAG: M20/M25/M40 family metallo-hydrolase [Clostridia bacterium]